jgi:hypothetical protein
MPGNERQVSLSCPAAASSAIKQRATTMSKTIAAVCIGLTLAAAADPAFARAHHHRHAETAPASHINSGWGPPSNWNEIEVSHPEGGGN